MCDSRRGLPPVPTSAPNGFSVVIRRAARRSSTGALHSVLNPTPARPSLEFGLAERMSCDAQPQHDYRSPDKSAHVKAGGPVLFRSNHGPFGGRVENCFRMTGHPEVGLFR